MWIYAEFWRKSAKKKQYCWGPVRFRFTCPTRGRVMRLVAILTLAGCLSLSGGATTRRSPVPSRLIDVHVHIWSVLPTEPRFQPSLLAAIGRYHLQRAVVTGPVDFVPGAVALAPRRLLGGFIYGAGVDLPPVTTYR